MAKADSKLEELRAHYGRMPDYDVVRAFAAGRASFASDDIWQVVADEYARRQLRGSSNERAARREAALENTERALTERYAPFGIRVAQGSADVVIAWLLGYAAGVVPPLIQATGPGEIGPNLAVFSVVFFGYHILPELRRQASPVMRVLGLRVVTTVGGSPGFGRIAARALLKPLGLAGLLWYMVWRTPWGHDVISGTRVVTGPPDAA